MVDEQLQRVAGVDVGDTLSIGTTAEPVEVVSIVDDVSIGAPTVWVSGDEWRRVVGATNPAVLGPDGSHQVLVVRLVDDDAEVADRIAAVAPIEAVTPRGAIAALDVVQQQSSTFTGIIGVTFVVTLLVAALFFALITLERAGLYAVLKALGGTTAELLGGLAVQAVLISACALVLGGVVALVFTAALPAELPVRVEPTRLIQIAVGTVATSVVGSLFAARRLLRIDPAEAIG